MFLNRLIESHWRLICHHSTGHDSKTAAVCSLCPSISAIFLCKKPKKFYLYLEPRTEQHFKVWSNAKTPRYRRAGIQSVLFTLQSTAWTGQLQNKCLPSVPVLRPSQSCSNHIRESTFPGKLGMFTVKRPINFSCTLKAIIIALQLHSRKFDKKQNIYI